MEAYSVQGELDEIKAKTYLNRGEKRSTDVSRGLDKTIKVDDLGFELNSAKQTEKWGDFSYGAAYYFSTADGTSFSSQEETTASLFLIDAYSLSDLPVQLSLGLRTNFNSAFDDAFNPEIKITYSQPKGKATVSYNRTNNTPSFYQRYRETSTTQPNPDLGMEVADNFSAAFFFMLSKQLGGSLTLFHNRLTDRITYTYGDNGTSSYQNVGIATYTGGDVSFTWKPNEIIQWKANYTYLEARDEDTGLDLPAKSDHKGRIDLTYTPVERLSMILTGRGASSAFRNRDNTTLIPGYFLFDYKLEYQFPRFDLFMEINNILDKEYLYTDGLLAPPLTWFVGIKVRI